MLRMLLSLLKLNVSSGSLEQKINPEEVKLSFFEKIPEEIITDVFSKLLDEEKVKMVRLSHRHHQLFKSQVDLSEFIHYVTYGEQDKAEAMLKKNETLKNKEALNYLLTKKTDVTDIAGKKFKNITAFQYTLWALDDHMWRMLLKYLPVKKAKVQLEDWQAVGVTYTKPSFLDQKEENVSGEKNFDFSPLINALKKLRGNVFPMGVSIIIPKSENVWITEVGIAQRNVVAHIVNEYCRPDRSFHPTPKFEEKTLPRNLSFYNDSIDDDSDNESDDKVPNTSWFHPHLGKHYAIARSARNVNGERCKTVKPLTLVYSSSADYKAIIALRDVKLKNLDNLKEELLILAKTPTSCEADTFSLRS